MFDQFAKKATDWDNNPTRKQIVRKFIHIIRKHSRISPTSHITDFGCGTGLVGLHFASASKKVSMVDTSPAMIEVLNKKIEEHGYDNVHVFEQDLDQIEDQSNLIVSLMTFHHIDNHADILQKVSRKLDEDGIIIIADLMPEDGSFHYPETVPHNGIQPKTLSRHCKKAGLDVEWCYQFHSIHKQTNHGLQKSYDLFVIVARKPRLN